MSTRWVAALALAMPVCAQATAAASVSEQLLEDQLSVRELIRHETAQTAQRELQAGRGEALPGHLAPAARQPEASDDAVMLLGIYGWGKRLTAQLLIGGRQHLYRQGRAQPLARARLAMSGAEAAVGQGYTLVGISASCVELERAGSPVTLCLHPQLPIQAGPVQVMPIPIPSQPMTAAPIPTMPIPAMPVPAAPVPAEPMPVVHE